jgi:hypothetical protein
MSSSRDLKDLAQQLIAAVAPLLATSRSTHNHHVYRDIEADEHGGARKEWNEVRDVLKGYDGHQRYLLS